MNERTRILKLLHESLVMRICRRATEDIDLFRVRGFCRSLLNCIGAVDYDFESFPNPFVLNVQAQANAPGEFIFNAGTLPKYLNSNCNSESNIIIVDYSGKVVKVEQEYFRTPADVSEYSLDNPGLFFFIVNRQIHTIIAGQSIDCIPNVSSFKYSYTVRGDEFHIDEWNKILMKYEKELRGQKALFYWATPKTDGLLLDAPEKLFRKDLAKYIEQNTIDCFVDEEAYNDNGTDRVDIRVITGLDQGVYYFELKCLGKCLSGTTNNETHAHNGLAQTSTYVENDSKSVFGVLIVFDGREKQNEIKWPEALKKKLDKRVFIPPSVMRLERLSASEKAKVTVKDLKSRK